LDSTVINRQAPSEKRNATGCAEQLLEDLMAGETKGGIRMNKYLATLALGCVVAFCAEVSVAQPMPTPAGAGASLRSL
jgi:hypothetical protein